MHEIEELTRLLEINRTDRYELKNAKTQGAIPEAKTFGSKHWIVGQTVLMLCGKYCEDAAEELRAASTALKQLTLKVTEC